MKLLARNKTLSVPTWNLLPVASCPGATEWCAQNCYARQGQYMRYNVKPALLRNYQLAQQPHFKLLMDNEIQTYKLIRLHSSGDFFSAKYIQDWIWISSRHPDTQFLAFTHSWSVPELWPHLEEWGSLPNCRLWLSIDPFSPTPPNWPLKAYIEGTRGASVPNCPKQLYHSNCHACQRCFYQTHGVVTFKTHLYGWDARRSNNAQVTTHRL